MVPVRHIQKDSTLKNVWIYNFAHCGRWEQGLVDDPPA
jgi:hypothetical protein